MVLRVHVLRSVTEILWSFCGEYIGMVGIEWYTGHGHWLWIQCTTITRAVTSMIVSVSSSYAESIRESST